VPGQNDSAGKNRRCAKQEPSVHVLRKTTHAIVMVASPRRWPNWLSFWMCTRTRSPNGEAGAGRGGGLFGADRGEPKAAPRVDLKALPAQIGELTLENDFLEGRSPRRDC